MIWAGVVPCRFPSRLLSTYQEEYLRMPRCARCAPRLKFRFFVVFGLKGDVGSMTGISNLNPGKNLNIRPQKKVPGEERPQGLKVSNSKMNLLMKYGWDDGAACGRLD